MQYFGICQYLLLTKNRGHSCLEMNLTQIVYIYVLYHLYDTVRHCRGIREFRPADH